MVDDRISTIVPTIGRPESLRRLLVSLANQTQRVEEIVIADGSADGATAEVAADPCWSRAGLKVKHIAVRPPHAVRQREVAIAASTGELMLMLDDDVELEPECVSQLVRSLREKPTAVAVMADFSNQSWAMPTFAWRMYLRMIHGLADGAWQGRVLGPLLRYGFEPSPKATQFCEWVGSGNSLIRRSAFVAAGGYSDFFLHRSTTNEDVDLSLRLSNQGALLFCPQARLAHFHDPVGRVSTQLAAEDDLYNRYFVLVRSADRSKAVAFGLVVLYTAVEGMSNLAGAARRLNWSVTGQLLRGRFSALRRIIMANLAVSDNDSGARRLSED